MSLLDKKTAKLYENASTQIDVPEDVAAEIVRIGREMVPDGHLAGDGRVLNSHITIKYGVAEDAEALRRALAGQVAFRIDLAKTEAFPPGEDGSAPVVVSVHGDALEPLHKAVEAAMGTLPDEFPYTPHITVAYVKPEEAQHYAGRGDFEGVSFEADAVTLYRRDDEDYTDVPLAKAAAVAKTADTDILVEEDGGTAYGDYMDLESLVDYFEENRVTEYGSLVGELEDAGYGTVVMLHGIEVEGAERGKGVGGRLLARFLSEAHGIPVLLLADTAQRQGEGFDLVAWYRQRGFEDTGAGHVFPLLVKWPGKGKAAAKRFYHGSAEPLAPGTVLRPSGEPSQFREREKLLEERRPEGALSRLKSVFMTDDPHSARMWGEHVYEVAPAGRVERNSVNLFEDLVYLDDEDWIDNEEGTVQTEDMEKVADAYWAGEASPEGGGMGWEYRAPAARVVRPAKTAASPAVTPEIPGVAPEIPQGEPEEGEEVERDEPAARKSPLLRKKRQPKPSPEKRKPKPPSETRNFRSWFGKSKVVGGDGKPLVVYHGTTHDFSQFDPSTANAENYYGKALYFTSSTHDLRNYATVAGPDITSRIEHRAEQIAQELQDLSDEEVSEIFGEDVQEIGPDALMQKAREKAKEEIAGQSQGISVPVYLSLQNPVYVERNGGTRFEFDFDEETGEESGSGMELYNAMHAAAAGYGTDPQKLWGLVVENFTEFSAWDFERLLRDHAEYVEDDEGNVATGSYIADVYREMGFDGIVQDAWEAFGHGGRGRMEMEPGTKHYILWDPTKVKSAIGNTGKFDPRDPSITAADERSVGDLGLARKVMRELMPVLGAELPEPELKIVNQPRAGWLGRDTWKIWIRNGEFGWNGNTVIDIQKAILNDERTLRRIIAHELCHHADSLVNGVRELRERYQGMGMAGYRAFLSQQTGTGHGASWRQWAQKYNAKYGADFVTEKSDETYVQEELPLKPYWIAVWKHPSGKFYYAVTTRFGTSVNRFLQRKERQPDPSERMTKTTDRLFIDGATVGQGWSIPSGATAERKQERLRELWDSAPAEMPKPVAKPGEFTPEEQDEFVRLWKETEERRRQQGKTSAVGEEAKRRLETANNRIVEEKTIGDYDFFVAHEGSLDIYQIGMQRTGMDALDVGQQMEEQPGRGIGFTSRKQIAELAETLRGWLAKYHVLFIGSMNPAKTLKYKLLLRAIGFKPRETEWFGHTLLYISDGSATPKLAGKRDEETTSLTFGADEPGFPSPVLVRWEQGLRWRQVLKAVKAIAGEVAGKRVPWRGIHIWGSLWEDRESQDEGWEQEKAKGTRVMYDVLPDGTFTRADGGQSAGAKEAAGEKAPSRLYHVTDSEFRDDILANGLDPAKYDSKGVFFATKRHEKGPEESGWFDTWEVDVEGLDIEPDTTTTLHPDEDEEYGAPWWVYWGPEPIEPERLKLMRRGRRVQADSHKVTPLDETYYDSPGIGEETNAYADIPERVRGVYDVPPLATLAPQLFKEGAGSLRARIAPLRARMAAAAQEIYDAWESGGYRTSEGGDVEFGEGGICDSVAREIGGIIAGSLEGVDVAEGGQEGDDHAWVIAYDSGEACGVDIPHTLYERGGGYSWTKVPGVVFSADDVEIFPLDIDPAELAKEASAHKSALLNKSAGRPSFPPTFAEYVEDRGGLEKYVGEMGDAWSHYEEALGMEDEWDDLPEDEKKRRLEEYVYADMEQRYSDRAYQYNNISFPVDIWRKISLKDPKALKTKGIGVFWAWDEDKAEAHWGTGGDHVMLHAVLTSPSQVDWDTTMLLNLDPSLGEEEDEVRLKDGTRLRLVGVESAGRGGYGVGLGTPTRVPQLRLPMSVTAVYAEGQSESRHTDHEAVGLTKALKSNPFAEELEALHRDLGLEAPDAPPALDGGVRSEGQPRAKGEDQLQVNRTGAATGTLNVDELDSLYERAKENLQRPKAVPDTAKRPAQRPVTNTPEFRAWFGDSKVVDGGGNPLMALHATVQDFGTFKTEPRRETLYAHSALDTIGAWFTTDTKLLDEAHKYFMRRVGPSQRTMPVYLSIQKPLVVGERRDLDEALDRLVENTDPARWGRWQAAKWEHRAIPAINVAKGWRKALEKSGYDGIHIRSDMYGEAWVALFPNQIKSAIGNVGAFDPGNPEITASKEAARRYYHASDAELAPGTTLTPGRAGLMSDYPEVNAFLERNRPEGKLPREKSVFMTSSFDAATWWGRFVYEVQPVGKVERNDYAWFEDLIAAEQNGELEDSGSIAGYYWSGEPHSDLWEYRAPEAKVLGEATKRKRAAGREGGHLVVYHGTDPENIPSMLQRGIVPREDAKGKSYYGSWAADTLDEALRYGRIQTRWRKPEEGVAVAVIRLADSGLEDLGGVWKAESPIPPEAIIRFDVYDGEGGKLRTVPNPRGKTAKGFEGDPRDTIPGQVYLLHFDIAPGRKVPHEREDARKPFHARHYLGWATDAQARIQQHYEGTGAKITQALRRKGITFTVARVWDDRDRNFERRLKSQGGLSRWCPICHSLGLVPESRYRAPAMEEVEAVPKKMRYGPDYVEKRAARRFPPFEQWAKAHPDFGAFDFDVYTGEALPPEDPDAATFEELRDRYAENTGWLGDLKMPLEVYRAVEVEKGAPVNLEKAGVNWTWDENSADAYFGGSSIWARAPKPKHPELAVIKAVVSDPGDVDFDATLFNNMQNPQENEITLRPGAKLRLVGIDRDLGGYRRPKGQATVTAAREGTFYHGTTWDAAALIDEEGIKAKNGWVYCTDMPGKAYDYGKSISWHELDKPEQSAVVEFAWDGAVEADPEHARGDAGKSRHRTEGYFRIPADIPRSGVRRITWFKRGDPVKTAAGEMEGVAAALDEIEAAYPANPENPDERVFKIKGKPAAYFEVAPSPTHNEKDEPEDRLRLKGIHVVSPGQGVGSLLLRRLLRIADRYDVIMELTASPYGDEASRLGKDELREWYRRHRFEDEPGYDPAMGYMVRKPS